MTKDEQNVCFVTSWLKGLSYKGLENFLRRVAFNLGNTPSKTEVKIVSCIPIDVTELQERIACLERQLEEKSCEDPDVIYTNENYNTGDSCQHADSLSVNSGSAVSSRNSSCKCNSISRVSEFMYDMELNALAVNEQPDWLSKKRSVEDETHETRTDKKLGKEEKEWFRKQKKIKNEPLVYYAEMKACSSFPRCMRQSVAQNRRRQRPSKTYLEKVMSKQYKPKVLVFDSQSTGDVSAPVCRESLDSPSTVTVDSDLCSCCYGNFQNVDKYMGKSQYSTILEEPSTSRHHSYYDDQFYDIVPVKEKTNEAKVRHEEKLQQKINMQEVLAKMDMLCKPSEIRPKIRPVTVNYHTITPSRNWDSQKLNRKEKYFTMNRLIKKQKSGSRPSTNTCCSFECGHVYVKNVNPGIKLSKLPKSKRMMYTDSKTLPTNKAQEQKNNDNQTDIKTEETLKQIKSILISVLTEVKSSSQSQTLGKEKRDVVIQKGMSHSDMVYSNSGILHNFSYSPYGMNPFVANSQMHPNVCYPMTCPLRYSQNYPILVQTQARPLCTGCYKPRSKESQQFPTKRIVSASTNTANESKRTTETENLIKEIYKSMALGLETSIPTRNTEAFAAALKRGPSDKSVVSKAKSAKPKIDEVTTPFVMLENKSVTARVNVTSYGEEKQKKRLAEEPPPSDIDAVEEESESEDSTAKSESAESESTVIPAKDTSKGLFSKMMSSIFKKNKKAVTKRSKSKKETVSDDDASDSDDYQTVYSHEVATTSPKREIRRPPRTTYSHSKRPIPLHKERNKKYNYFMDEDYRRQWAMKLAERENRRYIERPRRVASSVRARRNAYGKNYEALQALMQYREEFDDGKHPLARGGQRWVRPRSARSSADENEAPEKSEGWLKRHKLLPKCLPEWKKIIFER